MTESQQLREARETIEQLSRQQLAAEERAEKAEAKLTAIGRLCPTHFDDREQLLGTITRILRGQFPAEEDLEE